MSERESENSSLDLRHPISKPFGCRYLVSTTAFKILDGHLRLLLLVQDFSSTPMDVSKKLITSPGGCFYSFHSVISVNNHAEPSSELLERF